MPDSLITKRALASSLKELMKTQPLTKISVGDICEKCGMNRKSFYYHFCDKYDLVNWIFDTEFSEIRNRPDHIANFEEICEYFLFRPRVLPQCASDNRTELVQGLFPHADSSGARGACRQSF